MIVGVGNPVYDFIKTPFISTKRRVLSGCSTNACLTLSKLEAKAALVGCVGSDFYSQFTSDMAKYQIDYEVTLCHQTGGFSLVYDDKGDRTLDVLGIADPLPSFPDRFAEADFVLFGPILQETPLALIEETRRKTKAPFILDPQGLVRKVLDGRIVRYRNPQLEEIIPYFDIVKANEHETEVITGINPRIDGRAAARELYSWGCKIAIVTLAEAGSIIYDGQRFYIIPAYETLAKDPTGAGDTYAGAFMYKYLQEGSDLQEVGCFASSVGSIMVENTGPDFPLELAEVERRAAVLLDKSRYERKEEG